MIASFTRCKPYLTKLLLTIFLATSLLSTGCEETNLLILADAGYDAVNAATLSDEDVRNLAEQAAKKADSINQVAPPDSAYSKRLKRLVADHVVSDGVKFNFKVYLTEDVNAFAMADGTVRVYSGLMDLMDDLELLFVIGHEMGHVVEQHSRRKVVVAYASSALRKGLASQQNEIGLLARSVVGAFTQQLINAQFSQREEKQADNYGAEFIIQHGYGIDPAVSALQKLASLGSQGTILSSHPDPDIRAVRLSSGAYKTDLDEVPSLISRILTTMKNWLIHLIQFLFGLFQ